MSLPYNVLITGADDFLAPYLYDAVSRHYGLESQVWMLSHGPGAGVRVDLSCETVALPAPMDLVVHLDSCDGGMGDNKPDATTFVQRAVNLTRSLEGQLPGAMVYISSTGVYGLEEGVNINESTSCNPRDLLYTQKLEVEKILTRWCRENQVPLAILRPAMIVGTGMGGELRRIVNAVWRGTYRHVRGNEARVSVVHAVSVADAVVAVAGLYGVWNVTDGQDPSRHDLVEALSARLDHKRVYTLDLSKARLLARIGDWLPVTGFTTKSLQRQLSTITFDSSRLISETQFKPVAVVEYLKNHNYDESSR